MIRGFFCGTWLIKTLSRPRCSEGGVHLWKVEHQDFECQPAIGVGFQAFRRGSEGVQHPFCLPPSATASILSESVQMVDISQWGICARCEHQHVSPPGDPGGQCFLYLDGISS